MEEYATTSSKWSKEVATKTIDVHETMSREWDEEVVTKAICLRFTVPLLVHIVCVLVIVSLGFTGNIFVMCVYIKKKPLNVGSIFIIYLAMVDIFGCIIVPFHAILCKTRQRWKSLSTNDFLFCVQSCCVHVSRYASQHGAGQGVGSIQTLQLQPISAQNNPHHMCCDLSVRTHFLGHDRNESAMWSCF